MTAPNQNTDKIAGIPAEKAREIMEERKTLAEANKVAFPGFLAAAFAAPQTVEVGEYKVRPFFDGDIDTLQTLNHPLAQMLDKEAKGGWGDDIQSTRGQLAWNLCYLMTTPVEEIEQLVETTDNWIPKFEALAKAKFRNKVVYRTLVGLQAVIVQQFTASFATVIGFEEADEQGTKKKQSSTEP